jgi:hypothetical protein
MNKTQLSRIFFHSSVALCISIAGSFGLLTASLANSRATSDSLQNPVQLLVSNGIEGRLNDINQSITDALQNGHITQDQADVFQSEYQTLMQTKDQIASKQAVETDDWLNFNRDLNNLSVRIQDAIAAGASIRPNAPQNVVSEGASSNLPAPQPIAAMPEAQTTDPDSLDKRRHDLAARIEDGLNTGEIVPAEASILRSQLHDANDLQNQLRGTQAMLTPGQAGQVSANLDQVSSSIDSAIKNKETWEGIFNLFHQIPKKLSSLSTSSTISKQDLNDLRVELNRIRLLPSDSLSETIDLAKAIAELNDRIAKYPMPSKFVAESTTAAVHKPIDKTYKKPEAKQINDVPHQSVTSAPEKIDLSL